MVYEIQTIIRLMIETWMIVLWMIVSYPFFVCLSNAALIEYYFTDHTWKATNSQASG